MTEPVVTHDPYQLRYEAHQGSQVVGRLDYEVLERVINFTHTVVLPEFEGQGVGSTLVRHALDDVRKHGRYRVNPICPFVAMWIKRHPPYVDLLAEPDAD